ncbi:TPA_asm: hypothetical protein GNC22_002223 [Salmonella enterica subsp. enterica serovar Paratyphi B]|uniref:Uncharacterized protein n=1 Tax=Salmonella paratyphi B TaxID=57045 RepID=A0A735JQS1_SALEB|nr:hypothetical protein [Salmonella enterica subsp. enterica serovar Paratyphi B]
MGDILVPHRRQPSAVQIRIRRICHCVAACLQLELFRVYEYKVCNRKLRSIKKNTIARAK